MTLMGIHVIPMIHYFRLYKEEKEIDNLFVYSIEYLINQVDSHKKTACVQRILGFLQTSSDVYFRLYT